MEWGRNMRKGNVEREKGMLREEVWEMELMTKESEINIYIFPFCRKMEICENMWKFSVNEGSRSAHIIYNV